MASVLTDLRDFVWKVLNDNKNLLSVQFYPSKSYLPETVLDTTLPGAFVYVVPTNWSEQAQSRQTEQVSYTISIFVQKKINNALVTSDVDALVALAEEIAALFTAEDVNENSHFTVSDCDWDLTEIDPVWNFDSLRENDEFVSVIKVTFVKNK